VPDVVAIDTKAAPEAPVEVVRLPAVGRAWRIALLLVVAGLFLGGTFKGTDDWWPFGPWRMFATSTAPSGSVISLAIQVQIGNDLSWRPADLSPRSVGLTRAEVEGRVPQMISDPALLGTLAHTHSRLRSHAPAWHGVRVVRNEVMLSGGAPTGQIRTTTVASWVAGS
jgi:hypothetical protein